jgi:hypothetical protein
MMIDSNDESRTASLILQIEGCGRAKMDEKIISRFQILDLRKTIDF